MKVHHVSAIVATLAVACSSASTSESDASVVDSGSSDASQEASGEDAGTTPGDCVPVMNANPLQSDIESLAHALNLWTWSAEVRGAKETKVDECDSTIAYRIGPILAQGTLTEYARCALIKGSVIEVTGGTLNRPSSCTLFACGPKLGMTWSTGSGSVFQLDASGRPTGAPIFYVRKLDADLFWTGVGGSNNGYRMAGHPGDNAALACN